MKVLYRSYKKYSGTLIKGSNSTILPYTNENIHMWRAFYLATQVEAPKWGSVQSYDGAGISGGPFHYTACHPKTGKQGSLFSLLRYIELGIGTIINKNLEELWHALNEVNWYVSRDGKLRSIQNGGEISGIDIRNEFAPKKGKVPKHGNDWEKAKKWAILLHQLLSDKSTFNAQTEHAIEYLVRGQKKLEQSAYNFITNTIIELPETIRVSNSKKNSLYPIINLKDDLAMCVYHSHSVNAPGIARKCLNKVLRIKELYVPQNFAKDLIYLLGTSDYGRWQDTDDDHNRYDKTRIAATNSGLWPNYIIQEIMPENIKEK